MNEGRPSAAWLPGSDPLAGSTAPPCHATAGPTRGRTGVAGSEVEGMRPSATSRATWAWSTGGGGGWGW